MIHDVVIRVLSGESFDPVKSGVDHLRVCMERAGRQDSFSLTLVVRRGAVRAKPRECNPCEWSWASGDRLGIEMVQRGVATHCL